MIKCKGHSNLDTREAKGKEAADQAAKLAAGYHSQMCMIKGSEPYGYHAPQDLTDICTEQEKASEGVKQMWKNKGASSEEIEMCEEKQTAVIWRGPT